MRRLLLLLICIGCGGGNERYFDLHKNAKWTYVVSMDGDEAIIEVKATGRAPVGKASGWLLESPMGQSRLGWDGNALVASELAGTVYSPPIPIFADRETKWSGVVSTPITRTAGTAVLKRETEDLPLAGKTYSTVKTTLTLLSGKDKVELTTWFYPELGILRQEQRSGEGLLRNRRIDFVSSD